MSKNYGATFDEWVAFDIVLGLTEDLLPVVSNPEAEVSKNSAIKQKGKVPSKYNRDRKVVGISEWTAFKAAGKDITQWSKETDYGICVQTRHVRALDIDVSSSAPILNFIWGLGFRFPLRQRANSGKCLFVFRLPGQFAKRVCRVEGGIVEFLANGQQFIAAGTHTSGARYEWADGLPDTLPELTTEEFESLWQDLTERFAVEAPAVGHVRRRGETFIAADETLDKLKILEWGPQGQAHIECPFAVQHTVESGISSTSYFPKGTQGYEQGHFVCLHAHCASRTDEDFLDALGLRAADFDSIAEEVKPKSNLPSPWPVFKRKKSGEIHAIIDNLYQALKRDDVCDSRIAYDEFRDEVVITSAKTSVLAWRPLADNDYTVIQRHLERRIGFDAISIELLRRVVQMVAYENSFDSAQVWIRSLTWDGKPRVDRFMADYARSDNNAYARAVSRYMWSALAARALVPGIKADMVPIWESGQGRIKSSAVEALVPDTEFFLEVDLNEKEVDLVRKMRGKLVGEINELRGLQTKDAQSINAFITRRHEEWVPKYKEKSKRFDRRILFIGTTNIKEILADETGSRRWLPINVGYVDIAAILRDRDQLWAEGRQIFLQSGICFEEAERLAPEVHKEYAVTDPWKDVVYRWLENTDGLDGDNALSKGYVTMEEVMRDALHIEARNMKGADGKRIAKILRDLNYERLKKRVDGKTECVWVPGEELV